MSQGKKSGALAHLTDLHRYSGIEESRIHEDNEGESMPIIPKKKKQLMGYSNQDNPFNDPELEKTFVWTKKFAAEKITPDEMKKIQKRKAAELKMIKKRREEREKEREQRNAEMEAKQRDAEAGKFQNWIESEEQFVYQQAKMRSQVRLREGRAKTIDFLVAYISAFNNKEEEPQVEMIDPHFFLNGLRIEDLKDLAEDIKLYKQLDSPDHSEFWVDLEVIVADELVKLQYSSSIELSDGINPTVAKELNKIIEGKTSQQLSQLQCAIEKKMANNQEVIDINYWESLLRKVKAALARARLQLKHQEFVSRLKEKEKEEPEADNQLQPDCSDNEEEIDPLKQQYETGQYSPKLLCESDLDPDVLIVSPEEDWNKLQHRRHRIRSSKPLEEPSSSSSTAMTQEEKEFERSARSGMGPNEGVLRIEENIIQDTVSWSEKYRPRKPRYFNRVHTGFEWNKYNQTHYDIDNPPPKIVQGYKFNIFYPDLIDKSQAPTYTVTTCKDNPDFAIIRFKAGPPYEDIAFKIVNREWNYSHKSGFRCQFINNILQLWFHFKRYRYRR